MGQQQRTAKATHGVVAGVDGVALFGKLVVCKILALAAAAGAVAVLAGAHEAHRLARRGARAKRQRVEHDGTAMMCARGRAEGRRRA